MEEIVVVDGAKRIANAEERRFASSGLSRTGPVPLAARIQL